MVCCKSGEPCWISKKCRIFQNHKSLGAFSGHQRPDFVTDFYAFSRGYPITRLYFPLTLSRGLLNFSLKFDFGIFG